MINLKNCLVFIITIALTGLFSCGSTKNERSQGHLQMNRFVDSLLQEMTLGEKAGQLTLFTSNFDQTGPTMDENYEEGLRNGTVGAVLNAYTPEYNRKLQEMAVEESRLGIPLLFGYDVIHGHRTIFPIPLGEAASWDLDLMQESAGIAAREASSDGINWTFAPMVDIARDARWGRIAEGAGSDPFYGKKVAKARVRGFQGEDLSDPFTLLACAKHFAAYGAARAGRDYNTVNMSERRLREIYLPPFKAAIDAGVGSFMTAFNELNGVPATGNAFLFREILEKEWDFNGFVVSDYTSINEMVAHGIVKNNKEAAELAFNAGTDMDMQGGTFQNYLPELVESDQVSEQKINQAVKEVLKAKYKLGLFEDPYKYCDTTRRNREIRAEEHLAHAREMGRKSIVLLKNEDGVLPLSDAINTLAVIGPMGDNRLDLIGSWSAAGEGSQSVSLLEGIRSKTGNEKQVLYAKGCDINSDDRSGFREAVNVARRADAVILAVGESRNMSGEAASRAEIDLPGQQLALAKALKGTGKPMITVLMNGRPLAIPWMDEHASAILETWFLGHEAGHAISDVLFGDENPSGKLPVSFPRKVGQLPFTYSHKMTGRPPSENKYTSKYLDVPNTALFPFGYGLSYTTFDYNNYQLSDTVMQMQDTLRVTVEIQNTGDRAGEEVVQMYIRDMVGSVTRPVKELKGFRKIALKPGAKQTISFNIIPDQLAFYDRDMEWKAEPGKFKVFVGTNSRDTRELSFRLAK